MEYKIVRGYGENIEEKVAKEIKDGWTPFGGVSVTVLQGTELVYSQAMIKVTIKD